MKKFTKTLVAAIVIAVSIAAIMIGCKKEESAQMKNGAAQTEQNMSESERSVLDFLANYDAMKRGMKTEEEPICMDDARWYWETTMNYCYGFAHESLCNMRLDTIRVSKPKSISEGYVDYCDVLETYDNLVSAVRKAYNEIDMEGKMLQLVMVRFEDEKTRDEADDIIVLLNTGSKSYNNTFSQIPADVPWYAGPFDKDDDWIWGLNLGKCDGSVLTSDAADQLDLAVDAYDCRNGSIYVPCPTCYTYFLVEPNLEQVYYGCTDPSWLFCQTGLTWEQVVTYCIGGEDLERYYEEIIQHTHTEGMETNPYGYYGYYKTDVCDGNIGGIPINYHNIFHNVYVYYATKVWRNGDSPFPVPVNDDED